MSATAESNRRPDGYDLDWCPHGVPYRYACADCDDPLGLLERREEAARVRTSGWVQRVDAAVPPRVLTHDAAIQKAIDDYLLMERKARAWDLALAGYKAGVIQGETREGVRGYVSVFLDWERDAVHPAQDASSS